MRIHDTGEQGAHGSQRPSVEYVTLVVRVSCGFDGTDVDTLGLEDPTGSGAEVGVGDDRHRCRKHAFRIEQSLLG